ncbi:MAG: dinitrogenase iron-molybdenum cofactor biosynthesis protein [Ignavibacteria bacterium CG22_combo_CG10-13_8_21_14_all_37_15]|nr:MAG: dinitrogenase iron-molybdenum cofactor biosynthesis protein [Ignavibacteria bacterium CG22_combo_CG10-13_8_21_14_all_37_15]
MENTTINIALVTDDGTTISQHFGRAKFFEVLIVENGKIVKREHREKMGHHNFTQEEHHHSNGQHGLDEHSHSKHVSMAEAIKDCQILLARGMGNGAYQSMLQLNIKPIVTDIRNIDEAVKSVINGTIADHTEKLH